ncbi:MAG TPA: hypothetical protein VMB80_05055 [Candidatus Acidoferrum sp.]|nr:hypothetical protein [Candidatus Acidoferrum sp.]
MKTKLFHVLMKDPRIRAIICIGLAGLATGCVFMRKPVTLTLAPPAGQPLPAGSKASLALGEFKDTRLVTDGFVLVQDENAYGPTEGAFVTEKPVAELFRDGLRSALEQDGFPITQPAPYELRGNLQSSGVRVIEGFMFPREIKFWLTARFDLVDSATGLTVWHDTYTGQNTTTNLTWNRKMFVVPACSNMLVNTITQLVSDRMFRRYFEPQPTNAP